MLREISWYDSLPSDTLRRFVGYMRWMDTEGVLRARRLELSNCLVGS